MKKFTQSRLWEALPDSLTGSSALDAALDEFVAEMQNYCREEGDLAERTRTLKIAVSDLAAIGRCLPYESKKKRAYPIRNQPCRCRHRV